VTGDELRKWREKQGYTQQQLAAKLGTHFVTVNRWENGAREIPSFLTLTLKALSRDKPDQRMTNDIKDSSGHDNHGRSINPEHIRQGLAPVLGEGASIHLNGRGYIELPGINSIGSELHKGFYIGIDIQPEGNDELVLCGTGISGHTSLGLFLRPSGKNCHTLNVELTDEQGKTLVASIKLSSAPAKRLLVSILPSASDVNVSELTLHEDHLNLKIRYLKRQNPTEFRAFEFPMLVGGFNAAGVKQGKFVGRMSQIFFKPGGPITVEHLNSLIAASREDITKLNGIRPRVLKSVERRQVFKDDLIKLRKWHNFSQLSDSDMKDASVVLFKWLGDRNPLLQDLCDELEIQLTLPGESDRSRGYHAVIQKDRPVYAQSVHIGTRSMFGFKWVPLQNFLEDMAFVTQGHAVSHGAFISFVRNKLGGGHFDERERKKWQKELASLPVTVYDAKAINFHMKELVRSVLESVEGCSIESQLRTDE
jgi:DNA-binding XRE family transcriptional regulator